MSLWGDCSRQMLEALMGSRRLAFVRMAHHHEDNDLFWQVLCKAVPSMKRDNHIV